MKWMASAQLAGLLLEIVGVVLMANAYLTPARGLRGRLRLLVSALLDSSTADGAEVVYEAGFRQESYRGVLRGLALIGLGFLVQAIALIVSLLAAPAPA